MNTFQWIFCGGLTVLAFAIVFAVSIARASGRADANAERTIREIITYGTVPYCEYGIDCFRPAATEILINGRWGRACLIHHGELVRDCLASRYGVPGRRVA